MNDLDTFSAGFWYPQGGSPTPLVDASLEGAWAWPMPDGGVRYFVEVGTPAWSEFRRRSVVPDPVQADPVPVLVPVAPPRAEGPVVVERGTVEDDAVKDWTIDPDGNPVRVGEPESGGAVARLLKWPARAANGVVRSVWPHGLPSWYPMAMMALALLFWAVVGCWLYRRLRR